MVIHLRELTPRVIDIRYANAVLFHKLGHRAGPEPLLHELGLTQGRGCGSGRAMYCSDPQIMLPKDEHHLTPALKASKASDSAPP